MILAPYARERAPVPVAVVTGRGTPGDGFPAGKAFYTFGDTARLWLHRGLGRGYWWNAQLIAWEPEPGLCVRVIPEHGSPSDPAEREDGVIQWADWLGTCGVSLAPGSAGKPPASIGSAALRLLKRSLVHPVWFSVPRSKLPPIRSVIGGRQEQVAPSGSYTGSFVLWDISAAYARTLARTPYGGWWSHLDAREAHRHNWSQVAETGTPAFVRARVTMPRGGTDGVATISPSADHGYDGNSPRGRRRTGEPDSNRPGPLEHLSRSSARPHVLHPSGSIPGGGSPFVGPLPSRPRGHRTHEESALIPMHYPRAGQIQGTWTAAEIAAAERAGCHVRVLEAWIHRVDSHARPFAPWWSLIERGRTMDGYAGQLAKMTGNALLGQFHIDRGRRTMRWWEGATEQRRIVGPKGSRPPANDLVEHVTGTVRARLYEELIAPAGEALLSAHTDGGWVNEKAPDLPLQQVHGSRVARLVRDEPSLLGPSQHPHSTAQQVMEGNQHVESWTGWRRSDSADVIDLIDPQHLAYRRPGERLVRYKMAGVTEAEQERRFDEMWRSVMGVGVQRRTVAFDHVTETGPETRRRRIG